MAPDGTTRFAASHLGLFSLPLSHKKDTGLIWVSDTSKYICSSQTTPSAQLRSFTLNVNGLATQANMFIANVTECSVTFFYIKM